MGFPVFINKVQEDLESFIGKVFEDEVVDFIRSWSREFGSLNRALKVSQLKFLIIFVI